MGISLPDITPWCSGNTTGFGPVILSSNLRGVVSYVYSVTVARQIPNLLVGVQILVGMNILRINKRIIMKKLALAILLVSLMGFTTTGCNKAKKRYYTEVHESGKVGENTEGITKIGDDLKSILTQLELINSRLNLLEARSHNAVSISNVTSNVSNILARLEKLETNVGGIKKDGDNLIIEGCNLVIRDAESGLRIDGVGNLLIGREDKDSYTTFFGTPPLRTGSNNLVIGGANDYTGEGGLCVGVLNRLFGDRSAVFACENSTIGKFSTVLGGTLNDAKGKFSCVGGGRNRDVSGTYDWRAGSLFENQ